MVIDVLNGWHWNWQSHLGPATAAASATKERRSRLNTDCVRTQVKRLCPSDGLGHITLLLYNRVQSGDLRDQARLPVPHWCRVGLGYKLLDAQSPPGSRFEVCFG
jgi:hypothetical protein